MTIGEEELHEAIEDLAARPGPPTSIDAPSAIVRGRRIVRRRRFATAAATTVVAGGTAVVLALAVLAPYGANAHGSTVQQPAVSTVQQPPGRGYDPLTPLGSFGWLPPEASNAGYWMQDSQVQAVARGGGNAGGARPIIKLTIYPKGTTPTLDKFAWGPKQVRVDAPDVNGHTAYWVTASASDPTNGDDTYLRWQSADGQWGELNSNYLAPSSVTTELLRVAAGVEFTPHSVPLPLWISGLPSSTVVSQTDLNRPSLSGMSPWALDLVLKFDGDTVSVDVMLAAAAPQSTSAFAPCKTASGLTACVSMVGSPGSPSALSSGAAQMLKDVHLLGTDPANWTTAVIQK